VLDDRLGSLRALRIAITMSSVVLLTLVSVQPRPGALRGAGEHRAGLGLSLLPHHRRDLLLRHQCQIFAMFFVTGLSASRTLMARISPPEMATQFFGLFALSGTVTAFLAPLMVATTHAVVPVPAGRVRLAGPADDPRLRHALLGTAGARHGSGLAVGRALRRLSGYHDCTAKETLPCASPLP
jgi:hypothetical protein